jgi:hypothetical protein
MSFFITPEQTMQSTSNIGASFGQAAREQREQKTLSDILAEASSTNDPRVMNDTIGKILQSVSPERQGAAIQHIQGLMAQNQLQKKNQAMQSLGLPQNLPESLARDVYKEQTGRARENLALEREDLGHLKDLPPDVRKNIMDAEKNQDKLSADERKHLEGFKEGQFIISRMRELMKENPNAFGPLAGRLNPTSSAWQAQQEFESLKARLVGLSATFPIRNQKEFEFLTDKLPNATWTTDSINGSLNAFQNVFNRGVRSLTEERGLQSNVPSTGQEKREKKPLKDIFK